jgi:hypothetical protein
MALWGTADSLYSIGTVTVNYATETITGTATSFAAAGISTGTVISIGAGGTFGSAVISGITSNRVISIASTQYLTGAAIAGVAYTLSQESVYILEDSNYNGISKVGTINSGLSTVASVYGVDIYEQTASAESGSKYHAQHAGWVGIHTYIDMHGNLRVKSETLVAMSGITTNSAATYTSAGDANDDAQFPDSYISFSVQPSNVVGIATTTNTSFTITAASTPSAALTYQWQYSNTGVAYTNLSNGGIYSNVTTATVGIASTTVTANRPNGFYYKAYVTAVSTGATAVSNVARLTYS